MHYPTIPKSYRLWIFTALLLAAPPLFAQCVLPPSGLVSWWRGESNALDQVGVNHGALKGNVTFTNGMVGQGFNFNGTSSYVEIPHNASLNFTNQLTLEFWYKDLGSP